MNNKDRAAMQMACPSWTVAPRLYKENEMNDQIREDVQRLRDELIPQAFNDDKSVKCCNLAEVVFKLNSCLGAGYPRRLYNND
jgi:hypothetical protein